MLFNIVVVILALSVAIFGFRRNSWKGKLLGVTGVLAFVLLGVGIYWSQLVNLVMPYEFRPEMISFPVDEVNDATFDAHSRELIARYDAPAVSMLTATALEAAERRSGLRHIRRFREAGIMRYEGPGTCVGCHRQIRVADGLGGYRHVDLRENLTSTTHFTFAPMTGFSTYGFNGEQVTDFPLGKIDRACGVTGTFTWTGWAVTVQNSHGEEFSEGCGQCHVVGQYGPISGAMIPGYKVTDAEFAATDCLVCHAVEYDMNSREVVEDNNGKTRWNHDRRFIAAMSVGSPSAETCLRCHQHNLGGDTYFPNPALAGMGKDKPRLAHPGAKRGTPFGADWDVHAAAGLQCLDCHVTRGHKIARGTRGVDLVANDLPGVEVSCENCHGVKPHAQGRRAVVYNKHTAKIACETCHIRELHPDNLVFRDWSRPVFNDEHGIYTAYNAPFSGQPGEGLKYKWFNGFGTFMANALGDNPNGEGRYKSLATTPNKHWEGFESFDYEADYEATFRPIAQLGTSKIWPFKRFQSVMYEDLNNQGPYGGMILPIDYQVYYQTGDAVAAVETAVNSPMMKKMYGRLFKMYLMDRFMAYMRVDGWNMKFDMGRIAPVAMRNEGELMVNHAIQAQGRTCDDCHSPDGILDFDALGYSPKRSASLRTKKS
ncbi:MAG: nitrite reductase [Gammaproteobacteria bacterium]|nr:nitrite reductase [Gammaproteobacteria bacterium]